VKQALVAAAGVATLIAASVASGQPAEVIEQIRAAAPSAAPAKPARPRHLLVFTRTLGYRHGSIPAGIAAMKILGEKSGAFQTTHSEDPSVFDGDSLQRFDAILMLNTTGDVFDADPVRRKAVWDFVNSGGGLAGIHAATDTCFGWPEYGAMIGGYFDGHPWHERVVLRNEDPEHPVNAAIEAPLFEITDEIYQFREPYSRGRMRVLLSLDTEHTDMRKQGIRRTDGDFAVSWVRRQGEGRVFSCSLGHRDEIYWNPIVLRHYLAGIQFAMGDLDADTTPHGRGWTPLFNGKDLAGWKGLVADPPKRAVMSKDELAEAQAKADAQMREHWSVVDGVLSFDGKGSHLCTAEDYGDFEMTADWKISPGGDSGVYLRGSPQVQIWDPAQWPEGSGGLYNNQVYPSKPIVRADNEVGAWNDFLIRMVGERVSVWLNGTRVVDDVPLENYWERGKPISPRGQIELQSHGTPLAFRNVAVREIPSQEAAALAATPGWRRLFNGVDLEGWTCAPGSWEVEDGTVVSRGGGYLWTAEQFGDFTLEAEFKIPEKGNSGIFFRTGKLEDPVQTGIELQVYDTFGKTEISRNDCGAIYDCVAPRVQAVRKAGEWNHVVLTCRGPRILAWMNGVQIIDMNLDQWTEAHKNPDGTPNKFNTAYKDMPRRGYLGFQDHGNPVWYRNIRLRPLE